MKDVLHCKTIYILLRIDPLHAMKSCEGEQRYCSTCSYPLRYMEVNGQLHTPTALPTRKNFHRRGG